MLPVFLQPMPCVCRATTETLWRSIRVASVTVMHLRDFAYSAGIKFLSLRENTQPEEFNHKPTSESFQLTLLS